MSLDGNYNCRSSIDEFVGLVAGKNLSIRDIEMLAHGYFKGAEQFWQQMREGDIAWGLNKLKPASEPAADGCTTLERGMLKDLEITQKYMNRVICKIGDGRFKTGSFYAQSNLLTGGILRRMDAFNKAIRQFHDRTGKTKGDLADAHRRRRKASDSKPFRRRSKDGRRDRQAEGRDAGFGEKRQD